MRRLIIAIIFLLVSLSPSSVALAQAPVVIDKLQVDIWPEYDRPDVLVIYRITLSPQTKLPAKMSLRIPSQVGKPYNLAIKDVDGLLYNLENYTLTQQNNWLLVSFVTPSADIQLEYYDPSLQKQQTLRNYQYTWPGDYAVTTLTFQVQQPANSTQMEISPDMGTGRQGGDGLTYFTSIAGQIEAGKQFQLKMSYQKANDTLSFTPAPVGPIQPITQSTAGRTGFMEVLPWILGVFGFLLIAVGLFWYWQSGRRPMRPARLYTKPERVREISGSTTAAASHIYCHQCGKRATKGDLFCRACGTKLRAE
jgi:hypothetical protein